VSARDRDVAYRRDVDDHTIARRSADVAMSAAAGNRSYPVCTPEPDGRRDVSGIGGHDDRGRPMVA
jgi:hypothetical protein